MGGSEQKQETEEVSKPPEWWEAAAKKGISIADDINQIGFLPYMGNEIAAFRPQQVAGMQSASDWMSAANGTPQTNVMAGMPQATVDGSGVAGYSSAPGFMRNLEQIRKRFPEQYKQFAQLGGDLLANPSRTPGQINNSPWQVAKAIADDEAARGIGGGGGSGSLVGGGGGDGFYDGTGGGDNNNWGGGHEATDYARSLADARARAAAAPPPAPRPEPRAVKPTRNRVPAKKWW